MPRPPPSSSALDRAVRAVHNQLFPSIKKTAEHYGVPYSTLKDRLKGAKSHQQAYTNLQKLSPAEEKVIKEFIYKLFKLGFPANKEMVKSMANSILVKKHQKAGGEGPAPVVGTNWVERYLIFSN